MLHPLAWICCACTLLAHFVFPSWLAWIFTHFSSCTSYHEQTDLYYSPACLEECTHCMHLLPPGICFWLIICFSLLLHLLLHCCAFSVLILLSRSLPFPLLLFLLNLCQYFFSLFFFSINLHFQLLSIM